MKMNSEIISSIAGESEVCNQDSADGELIVKIKDSGIGMTEEQIQKLFLPFSQADSSI